MSTDDYASDDTRLSLWSKALNLCISTFGIGTGIGSLVAEFEIVNRGGITITHNMFMEFLCQYGLVFSLILLKFVINLFRNIKYICDKNLRGLLYGAFFAMPAYMVIDSGYLLYPQLFALFASLYVFIYFNKLNTTL